MEPDVKIIQNLSAQAESAIVMLLSKFLQNLETSLSTCCLRLVIKNEFPAPGTARNVSYAELSEPRPPVWL